MFRPWEDVPVHRQSAPVEREDEDACMQVDDIDSYFYIHCNMCQRTCDNDNEASEIPFYQSTI